MAGVEILLGIGGSAVLVPLLAGGCLFGSNKAVKYGDTEAEARNSKPGSAHGTGGNDVAAASSIPSAKMSTSGRSEAAPAATAAVAPAVTNERTGATTTAPAPSTAAPSAAPSNANAAQQHQTSAAATTGGSNGAGIHQEIKVLASALSDEANKLVLLEPIGQGGFGTVYLGRWRGLEVAVKTVLFGEGANNKGSASGRLRHAAQPKQRAIMEAAVCTSVMHANVVATYHYDLAPIAAGKEVAGAAEGHTDWKLYLIQEYCNASLQDAMVTKLLHNKETMAPDMDLVLSILMDIARGLQYIHEKNIIHGDLTPGNVLLKHDTASPIGVVGKITDFGLCSTIDPTLTHISNITNGTPYYVAPEVVECGMLTKTSDVYSFGVLMWELYRCMPPWVKTETGYQQNKRFRRFPPTSPHIYVAMCARCLDKRPKKRPNFTQILAGLDAMHSAYLLGYDSLVDPGAAGGAADEPAAAAPDPGSSTSNTVVVGATDAGVAIEADPDCPPGGPTPENPDKTGAASHPTPPPRSQQFVSYFEKVDTKAAAPNAAAAE